MNVDGKLRERLSREAAKVPGPRFTFDQVVRRGRRRRSLHRAVVGLGMTASVVALVGVTAWLLTPGPGVVLDGQGPSHRVVDGDLAPEPLFDPEVFGSEVRLVRGGSPTDTELAVMAEGVDLSSEVAIVSVGRLEGSPWRMYRAFGHIAPGDNSAGDFYQTSGDFWCDWAFNDDGSFHGPACLEAFSGGHPGTFSVIIGEGPNGLTVVAGIPDTVAVVTQSDSWQRPVAGVAAFPADASDSGRLFLDRYGVSIQSDAGPPDTWRDPMPGEATAVGSETLVDLVELAELRFGDLLYQLQAPGGAVLVRIRFDEPPLLFGTSCDLAQSLPLPTRWRGACLERTVDGSRLTGPWFYGTNLVGGGWTDDGWSGPERVVTPDPSLTEGVTTTYGPTG